MVDLHADLADSPIPPFDELLGLEFLEASAEKVVATLEVQDKHKQPYGLVHGGVYCSMAETVASFGAVLALGEQARGSVGQSNHTDFLRGTREGTLTATATPLHVGRSVQLWNVDITDADGALAAQSKVRMFNLRP